MRIKIQFLSSSKVVVSNRIWTDKRWVSWRIFSSHEAQNKHRVKSYQKDPNYVHWPFSLCVGVYSQDIKAGRSIWDGLLSSPLFIFLFSFSRRTSFFFFLILPKSNFKATNLEGIKAKFLWLKGGEMKGQESLPLSLPIAPWALLWGPLIQSKNLIAPWGRWGSDEGVAQSRDTQLTQGQTRTQTWWWPHPTHTLP